jgi:hypothetical protein
MIKSEGFSFLQLAGKYAPFKTHRDAYHAIVANVKDLILKEIKEYIVAVSPRPGSAQPKSCDYQEPVRASSTPALEVGRWVFLGPSATSTPPHDGQKLDA